MEFIMLILSILLLLLLITKFKLNTFVSLVITAIVLALLLGMNPSKIPDAVLGNQGMGNILGSNAVIFIFGGMIGRLVADAGGSYRIAKTLIAWFGLKRLQWAVLLASFIIGISMIFGVGMVLLIPIVFAVAIEAGVPLLYLGVSMTAALSSAQGFLPPQPAPTAVASQLNANIGLMLLVGLFVSVITAVVAGPVFTKLAQKYAPDAFKFKEHIEAVGDVKEYDLDKTPSFGLSVLTSVFPLVFMIIATIYKLVVTGGKTPKNPDAVYQVIDFLANPAIAMTISLVLAIFTMGIMQKRDMKTVGTSLNEGMNAVSGILLIVGGGGALRGVLVTSGMSAKIADLFQSSGSMSPITIVLFAWAVASLLRIAVGSATVAGITAVGVVNGILAANPHGDMLLVLVALAIGAGSLIASHVNDAGFWIFKEFFDLTVKQTFQIWTVLETVISITGLILILILTAVFV
ncbi:H+:gluconate symporter [Fructobacillus fructosus]|nr:gluconate:H+ symporter [Fructobacillus fructosus]KRN52593.1 H+:gluconate symporter [Fructobacillus fructosus KCTC 3544]MCK8638434.1 gluconate:H+ symporter [Fructobacillus fructosus]GAP01199.1 H+:gluconate symporter [Fructobacillus fructosus]